MKPVKLAILVLFAWLISGCTSWFFRLHGWLIEPGNDASSESSRQAPIGSVYFLHGNAENISSHSRAIYWLVQAGYEVFALDYRGYGLSQGKPGLPEVFDDIEAGARWLNEHRKAQQHTGAAGSGEENSSPVFLLGQSLGASLAISYAASEADNASSFDAVIVEAAFISYGEIARVVASRQWLTWLFQWPAKLLLSGPYDPLDAVAKLSPVPVLVIHSADDQVIPFSHGERLFDEALEPRQFIKAEGPHIFSFGDARVREQVLAFMSNIR